MPAIYQLLNRYALGHDEDSERIVGESIKGLDNQGAYRLALVYIDEALKLSSQGGPYFT